jgi:hypothetical protein
LDAAQKIDAAEVQALERLSELTTARMEASVTDAETVQAYIDGQQRRTELEAEFSQRRIDLAEQEAATKAALAQSEWGTYARLATESLNAVAMLSDVIFDRRLSQLEEGTEAHKKAAKRQFAVQKALGAAMSLMQGAQAVLSSIATLGPPVPPNVVGIAGVAAATTMAAASTAAILAAKPPALHTGGTVGRPAPDEADRRLRMGESVLNARASARIGQEAINQANAGASLGGGDGPTVVVVEYKNQVLDTQVSDLTRIPGSALRSAVKQGSRVGHRTR